ncbi:MAG: SemiSWEET family transporter [Candidatus Micrarchaeota archaeon]
MSLLEVAATIFGVVGGLANFPQAYKIFRRKSAKDISLTAYSMILATTVVWLLYGLEISSFAIIAGNALGSVSAVLVITGRLLYGR